MESDDEDEAPAGKAVASPSKKEAKGKSLGCGYPANPFPVSSPPAKKPKIEEKPAKKPAPAGPSNNGKPLASIFAKPAPKAKEEDADDYKDRAVEEEGEDEISDEEEQEQEEKAAVKL